MSAVLSACRRFFNKTFPIYNFLILLLIFIITAYPFWYILIYSLSDPARVGSEFLMFPIGFNLNAYRKAFESADLLRAFFISVGRSVIGTVLGAFITVMAAYGLSKKDLYGRKGITIYFIITMYFSAGMIPAYMVIKGLGLTGSFWVYILPLAMNAYNMVLMKSYIENIPDSMNESARLDGANDFVIFARIIIPLCIPVIAAVSLFTAVNHWNSYTDTLIYCSSKPELYTLQYVLMSLINNMASASTSTSAIAGLAASQTNVTALSVRMAVTIITILPISLLYPFLQKYFIKGIMVGAVKG